MVSERLCGAYEGQIATKDLPQKSAKEYFEAHRKMIGKNRPVSTV